MTRDSKLWWVLMACSFITAFTSRMDLLDPLLPADSTDKVHAAIELLAFMAGLVSAKLATSPLPISDDGREKYAQQAEKDRYGR